MNVREQLNMLSGERKRTIISLYHHGIKKCVKEDLLYEVILQCIKQRRKNYEVQWA